MKTIGCIGCGNMGGAVMKAFSRRGGYRLAAVDHTPAKIEALNAQGGEPIEVCPDEAALIRRSDVVLLSVKPQHVGAVWPSLREALDAGKILVSMCAAVGTDVLRRETGGACPVARIMPNLPAKIGKGVTALCLDDPKLTAEDKDFLRDLFAALGTVVVIPEGKFGAFTALAGCGPAYVALFMEGMQQAAVTLGFTAQQADAIVAGTVEGSAALAMAEKQSFADLRIRVCSPGGVTIHAVNHLERTAVRGHVTDAVLAAYEKDCALKK